jgi:hypothetical protein
LLEYHLPVCDAIARTVCAAGRVVFSLPKDLNTSTRFFIATEALHDRVCAVIQMADNPESPSFPFHGVYHFGRIEGSLPASDEC